MGVFKDSTAIKAWLLHAVCVIGRYHEQGQNRVMEAFYPSKGCWAQNVFWKGEGALSFWPHHDRLGRSGCQGKGRYINTATAVALAAAESLPWPFGPHVAG